MSSLRNLAIYTAGLLITFAVLYLIKIFDVSYPFTLTITNTTKSTELSVVGEGKVEAVPDTISVDLGISVAKAPTAQKAQAMIDEVNNKIITAMKGLGIPASDIKTSSYSITPAYSYEPNETNKIVGYNGNATVSVKIKEMKLATQVINEGTKMGANQVQGTRFTIDKPEKYREEARNKAIENAKEQAQKLAQTLGISLGRVVNVVESTSGNTPYPIYDKAMLGAPAAAGTGPQIEPGTQTITSTVTLYFEKK